MFELVLFFFEKLEVGLAHFVVIGGDH
jgi:hypothetical protein